MDGAHWSDQINHGGDLKPFVKQFFYPKEKWIDLSTAINPVSWLESQSQNCLFNPLFFKQFPDYKSLYLAAKVYYKCQFLSVAPGSQTIIWLLPHLFKNVQRVGIVSPTYSEHQKSWSREHQVVCISPEQIEFYLSKIDILVLVNPNNPTGFVFLPDQLCDYHRYLSNRGGCLIVDEAFVDTQPKYSMTPYLDRKGLIILRSLGKFFGVPGLRVGFLLSDDLLCQAFNDFLGIWPVTSFSAYCATMMLKDQDWQSFAVKTIFNLHQKMVQLFFSLGWEVLGQNPLFFYLSGKKVRSRLDFLAYQGIAVRPFDHGFGMRIGLCHNEVYDDFSQRIKNGKSI